MTDDDLPLSIGRPALGALRAAGIGRLSQVAQHREEELLALHGVGPKAVRLLQAELAARGLELPARDS
jgi:DNA-directed RNA polymerase alpha subunit